MKSYRASSLCINCLNFIIKPTTSSATAPKLTTKVKAAAEIRRLIYRKAKLFPFSIELIQYRAILTITKAHTNTTRGSLTGSGESVLIQSSLAFSFCYKAGNFIGRSFTSPLPSAHYAWPKHNS